MDALVRLVLVVVFLDTNVSYIVLINLIIMR